MGTFTVNSVATVLVGLVVVIGPFILKRMGELPFSISDIEDAFGHRSLRSVLGALTLCLIFGGAIFASFDTNRPDRFLFVFVGAFLVLAVVAAFIPKGNIYQVCVKLLELHLVIFGAAMCFVCLANIWVTITTGHAYLIKGRGARVSFDTYPMGYWVSMVVSGFGAFLTLAALREYFTRIYERFVNNATTKYDPPNKE